MKKLLRIALPALLIAAFFLVPLTASASELKVGIISIQEIIDTAGKLMAHVPEYLHLDFR